MPLLEQPPHTSVAQDGAVREFGDHAGHAVGFYGRSGPCGYADVGDSATALSLGKQIARAEAAC